jgi:hypothetical protein
MRAAGYRFDCMHRVDVDRFIREGFVRVDGAFSSSLADECRAILWQETGCDPRDSSTWTKPVVRLGMHSEPPFRAAANTDVLRAAFDDLVGVDRWWPVGAVGTFPVRFPSTNDPGDAGWHIDASFGFDESPGDFMSWRANVSSRGRALLLLLLFSDVDVDDAPTRIRVGSHADIARQLAPAGDRGLTLRELAADGFARSAHRDEALAIGAAGTAYLCHPFIVHSAQPHQGRTPRFMAQPPLLPKVPLFSVGVPHNAVERAIVDATAA